MHKANGRAFQLCVVTTPVLVYVGALKPKWRGLLHWSCISQRVTLDGPNVGIQRMAKPVRWNDGLGVTVAEAGGRRNAHKRRLELASGCHRPRWLRESARTLQRTGLDASEKHLSAFVTLTKSRVALRSCTAWPSDEACRAR